MTNFAELGLDPELLKALEQEGYTTPTPIQAQAIPSLLAGKDLLGIAQTGTGKTAAFALPILQRLAADRKPAPRNGARALILSPTRELATQIAESFKTYGRHLGFTVTTIFGGVGFKPQQQALARGIDILVATPGRLIDHMSERQAVLSSTEILVLDEADQMMDLGFIRPLRQIISKLPSRRQSMFFSATMPHEIGALAAELLRDPVKVAVTPVAKTADRVEQKVIFVEAPKKRALLVELFGDPAITRALVFTRTKRGADRVARHLEGAGIAVAAIHGNKSQGQREAALGAFKSSKIRALIATDIAARGIDIDQVSHVFNYELPNVPESYVHRIGRTARAGAEGIAISLCDGEERAYLRDIERLTRQTIPAHDRRGDTSLAVPAESERQGGSRHPGRRDGFHHRGRPGGRNTRPSDSGHADGRPGGGRRADDEHRREGHAPDRRNRGAHGADDQRAHGRDAHRPHGHSRKAEGDRSGAHRAEGHRGEGHRAEGHRSPAHRPGGHHAHGGAGGRSDEQRRHARPQTAASGGELGSLGFMTGGRGHAPVARSGGQRPGDQPLRRPGSQHPARSQSSQRGAQARRSD